MALINPSTAWPLLEVRRLSVTYHTGSGATVRAVRDLSLEIGTGEILALVGETGSGKSTVASALLGLLDPDRTTQHGEVLLSGRPLPPCGDERAWRAFRGPVIGTIFQDPRGSLNPVLTVGAQLSDAILAHKRIPTREAFDRAAGLLERVGLPEPQFWMRRYPYEVSGGMCQRIAIALAICASPSLLVADEPTSSLDPTIQAQILLLLEEMNRSGLAVLLISHNLDLVARHATRVAVMYHGRIMETGPAGAMIDDPRHPYTRGLVAANPGLLSPGDRLQPIPGRPPGAAADLPGCAFAPRCPLAELACVASVPPLTTIAPGRLVACRRVGEG